MSLTKVSYAMINGTPFNVLDYGADPTNTNDSYAAFQAAIDAVPANTTGGTIYVPAGIYKISAKLVITNKAVNFVGAGMNQTKLLFDAAATGGLEFDLTESSSSGTSTYYYNASVSNLSILTQNTTVSYSFNPGGGGTSASVSGKIAITYIPSARQAGSPYPTVQIDKVYIGGYVGYGRFWDVGIYVTDAVNVLITDCVILGRFNKTDMSVGVAVLNQAINVQLSNTMMSYGSTGLLVYSPGFSGVSNNGVEGIQVIGCQITGFKEGIYRYYGALTDLARPLTLVTGSHFNCMNVGISLTDTTETIITGNLFYVQNIWGGTPVVPPGASAIGIAATYFPTTSNRHTITGNIFRKLAAEPLVRGIVSNVDYVTISGNTFTDFDYGIILQANSSNTIVTGCVFEGVTNQIQNAGDTTNGYSAKTSIASGTDVNPF